MCVQKRSVSRLWSLTPCFAPACGLQELLYFASACPTLPSSSHAALCQLCTLPGSSLPGHPLKETFPALVLDTLRAYVNSACFSFSSHDREVFLTHYWLNIAQRNTVLASHSRGCLMNGRSDHLVRLEGYVCLSMCGCTDICWSVMKLGLISLERSGLDFHASFCLLAGEFTDEVG